MAEPFSTDGFRGEVAEGVRLAEVEAAVEHLTDPARAVETLHWGRNYLYVTRLEVEDGDRVPAHIPVVVKQFRNEGARRRLERRLRGSKAERSWRVAQVLGEVGIPTPEPMMLIESRDPEGPSFYVSRYLEGSTEARYLLRAASAGEAAERFPQFPMDEFLDRLAELVRRLHRHRIWFRDLTSGNVLLHRGDDGELRLSLVDLNRARVGRRLTLVQRTRDLSRMPIFRPEHQERLLHRYWNGGSGALWPVRRTLYLLFHHGFLAKNRIKQSLRALRVRLVGKIVPRGTHAHIPKAPEDAPSRERVVWDHLSDQPHLHATPLQKLVVRIGDARSHLEELSIVTRAAPRILWRYRALKRSLYREPLRPFDLHGGFGVALRPWPDDPDGLLELVDGLHPGSVPAGVEPRRLPILIRVHPWEPEGLDAEEALARALALRGHEVSFAVPQNRDLVRNPARWEAAVERIAERLTPYGRRFQVGQAINRSKWGVWTLDEYVELVRIAEQALRAARSDIEILGPAVIDFEYHATAAVLNLRRQRFRFDAVSALLYVDRRGAPEACQAGLDTVDKVALLRAIADTARNAPGRCWITEVNWPLWEGPHSPAGRSVSVDEEAQADYLVRYYLLALGTGLVERIYWWQMIARGYGLVCPEADGLRRRPSYRALATMIRQLAGATFLGPAGADDRSARKPAARLYRFRRPDGCEVIVAWSAIDQPVEATLPRPATCALDRDGTEVEAPGGNTVRLSGSPVYLHLTRG